MTKAATRRGGLMMFVMLLIALPSVLAETHAAPTPLSAPPALDAFLRSVGEATPPTARILVAGAPPALAFYRAVALLYPRRIYSAFPTDYAHSQVAPPASWSDLIHIARRDGARYILTWSLPLKPTGRAREKATARRLGSRASRPPRPTGAGEQRSERPAVLGQIASRAPTGEALVRAAEGLLVRVDP